MYTIKHAAEQVGVSVDTLRAWERRYGVVAPQRSTGGYRLYGEEDVRELRRMAQLVAQGRTPSLAARELSRQRDASPRGTTGHAALAPRGAARDRDDPDGGRLPPRFAEAFVDAAAALDAIGLSAVLDEMFAQASYETVIERYLLVVMDALGEAWASGRVSVAGEHLASHAVMRRIGVAYEAAGPFRDGPRVLLGLAPGRRHEIGLFAFAVAARRRGLTTDYLGADLPVAAWVGAALDPDVNAIVLAVPMASDAAATAAVIASVRSHRPDLLIAVGGGHQERSPDGVLRLGHVIGTAAGDLADVLAATKG